MKSVTFPKPGYTSIENVPDHLIFTTTFNDSSILITIISWDYLNVSFTNEYIGDVTIPIQVITPCLMKSTQEHYAYCKYCK